MLRDESLFLLADHYHTNDFDEAIEMAKADMNEVFNDTREYPPFIYYLVLENMNGNKKYFKTWRCMTVDEKVEAFNDTINELYKLFK